MSYFPKIALIFALLGCTSIQGSASLTWQNTWPDLPAKPVDPIEAQFVEARLSAMSLEEKVGQMLMIEHNGLSLEEAQQYKVGAMLHGGGQAVFYNLWSSVSLSCRRSTYLSLACWGELADFYWNALKSSHWQNDATPIPVLWGTDAMHGAGAIYGATLFPHNIGIGAALVGNLENVRLYEAMQFATREQVALQGFRQIFGPAVSVARNTHWGRTYESLSSNPVIQYEAAPYAVAGIQAPWFDHGHPQRIAATLKHFVGDGGTTTGTGHATLAIDKGFDPTDTRFTLKRTDRGINEYSEDMLRNVHAPGYFSGIEAGALSVMISFNAWENGALHADKYLIQNVLKDRLKFDGIVVTDWDAIDEVPGCSVRDCPEAIEAGVDMFMLSYVTPGGWQDFFHNTIEHVKSGRIHEARINDAVRRILRVKYRLGLFSQTLLPSETYRAFGYANVSQAEISLDKWTALAKSLAQKSMVLMKNEQQALPLSNISTATPLLVAGNAIDSPQMQNGGWGLYWQGLERGASNAENNKADYPQTVTVLDALKMQGIAICEYSNPINDCSSKAKTALVVMGEHPYAEWYGDIHVGDALGGHQTIEYATIRASYAQNEQLVRDLKAQGYDVVTVFFSGRPLVVDALNHSDAFVAGFLPGSQGGPAVVDLLFANNGLTFEGRLPMAWPTRVEQSATFQNKPTHFVGSDLDWIQALSRGRAREVLVEPGYRYQYGYGL